MKKGPDYSDPSGSVYVEAFADADEEAAWVEQERRIMEIHQRDHAEIIPIAA